VYDTARPAATHHPRSDALDSSKMTLMPLTARTQANVRSQTLAKVCGAAASGLSLLGAMAVKWPAF